MSVVAVKVNLLARNTTPTQDYVDTKTYTLGKNADGTAHTVTPAASDHYKRHLFQTLVAMPNPAGRRLP
jgi:type IV pilus assembly protein PilW